MRKTNKNQIQKLLLIAKSKVEQILNKFLPLSLMESKIPILAEVMMSVEKDIDVYIEKSGKEVLDNSILALLQYRVATLLYIYEDGKDASLAIMEECNKHTKIKIHPSCEIGEGIFLEDFEYSCIQKDIMVGEGCTFCGNVQIDSKRNNNENKICIGNNCLIEKGSMLFGNLVVGDNVHIKPNCLVTEDIEEGQVVEIVNQLQVKSNKVTNYIPSQKMTVYGVIPKFKNSVIIAGEGFYNPTVLIKLKNGNKELDYNIAYWDKNKIIIKIKNTTPFKEEQVENIKIIILSNSNKIVLMNNFGLVKALLNLCK